MDKIRMYKIPAAVGYGLMTDPLPLINKGLDKFDENKAALGKTFEFLFHKHPKIYEIKNALCYSPIFLNNMLLFSRNQNFYQENIRLLFYDKPISGKIVTIDNEKFDFSLITNFNAIVTSISNGDSVTFATFTKDKSNPTIQYPIATEYLSNWSEVYYINIFVFFSEVKASDDSGNLLLKINHEFSCHVILLANIVLSSKINQETNLTNFFNSYSNWGSNANQENDSNINHNQINNLGSDFIAISRGILQYCFDSNEIYSNAIALQEIRYRDSQNRSYNVVVPGVERSVYHNVYNSYVNYLNIHNYNFRNPHYNLQCILFYYIVTDKEGHSLPNTPRWRMATSRFEMVNYYKFQGLTNPLYLQGHI